MLSPILNAVVIDILTDADSGTRIGRALDGIA